MIQMDGNRLVGGLWCSEVLAGLSEYLDGNLGSETRAQVEQHLRECSNCKRFGADVAGMLATLSSQRRSFTDEIGARLKSVLSGNPLR